MLFLLITSFTTYKTMKTYYCNFIGSASHETLPAYIPKYMPSLLPANIQKMARTTKQLPLLAEVQMIPHKRCKLFLRHLKIVPLLRQLKHTVHTGNSQLLYRFFRKQLLKLGHIISGKQLLLKMPYLIVFCSKRVNLPT